MNLEEIVGYLPYGMMLEIDMESFGKQKRKFELDCGHDFNFYLQQNKIKLFLHPLSDLTKPITIDNKEHNPVNEMGVVNYGFFGLLPPDEEIIRNRIKTNTLTFRDAQVLFKYHFDIFGLIERGEAIDINTLEEK